MKTLLIGEAWGRNEAQWKHAFVGHSGQELIRMIGEAKLGPELSLTCRSCGQTSVFGRCDCGQFNPVNELEVIRHWATARDSGLGVTNVFHERPSEETDNVQLFFGSKTDDVCLDLPVYKVGSRSLYLLSKNRHWLNKLHEEITNLSPNLIVLLGNTACWAVIQQTKISQIRGTVQQSAFGRCLPTYHPAALRDWALRPIIVADLKKARVESEINYTYRKPRWLTIPKSPDDIRRWLRKPKKYLVCDIESGWALYNKLELKHMTSAMRRNLASQISIVGFARNPTDALVISLMTRDSPTLSVWEPKVEFEVWGLIQEALASPVPKIFQNGLYDINRLVQYGIRPTMCYEDTMLMSHSFWPEMLKNLGFLGSIFTREINWKSMGAMGESLKRDD